MNNFLKDVAGIACILALTMCLSSCGTLESILAPNPNVVATMQATLAAADQAAARYVSLPSCAQPSKPLICRDKKVNDNIKKYHAAALAAINAARANESAGNVEAAQNALNAYTSITDSLNTGSSK